ncbi:hypothetical protein OAG71_02750 [bacterium]|nr:hypothetical protein [bacterium]
MQLRSSRLLAINAALVCVMICFALDPVVAQEHPSTPSASVPVAPVVLNLSTIRLAGEEVDESDVESASGVITTAYQTQTPQRVDARPANRLAKNTVKAQHAKTSTKQPSKKKKKQGWVKPLAVVKQLETLATIPVTEHWAGEVQRLIEMLLEEPVVSSPASETILIQLDDKVVELDQIIAIINGQFADLPVAQALTSQLKRLRYDLSKRTVLWRSIQKLPTSSSRLEDAQLVSNQRLSFGYLSQDWNDFLQIEQLQNAYDSLNPDAAAKKKAARLTLARLASPNLSALQRNYLNQTIPASVISNLKETAAGDVNQYRLLKAIEWNDQNPSGVATHYINDQFQNLMWSELADRQTAATQLQAHYRNANVRLAVSQNMLNRLIPDSPAVNEPVHERVLGADVSGHSQIRNRLSVQLVEDPSQISLKLETHGEVDSDTVARRSGFEIRNEGMAKFQAFKKLSLDRMGVFSSDSPVASAQSRQRLIGIRSKLDPFPVVNWVARRIAKKKLDEQSPQAKILLEQKIEQSASSKLQEGVESQVAQMQAYLKVNLLEPLISMDLNPEALQLATTNQRLIMRYRLAGIDQMAADSPRPADSNYDYLSLQLHQSLLNNTIERIEIESETFTPESLLKHLSEVIGFNPENAKADSKHEAEFVFANYDAIRVDFVDGKIRIELNLKSLRVGKGKTWRNITISSTYVPTVVGSQVKLAQEGMIGVKGKRFRIGDQIAVRAIFNVVLPDSYEFDAVPKKLAQRLNGYALVISKLNIADGWVGLTYDEVPITYSQPYEHQYEQPYEQPYVETVPQYYEASGEGVIYSDGSY